MLLPDNSIGVSDILQARLCGTRWEFDMQRWSAQGERPGATNPNNAYGSAMHHAIALSEEGFSDEEAIEGAVREYGRWLDPDDVEDLADDMEKYHERDYVGVRTVASEQNMKVPLFRHEGEQIYYRFTLDRLYVRVNNPTSFIHIDYKSSKHRKSDEEVHKDPQLWAYNWAIFEMWPECEDLHQVYDQFNFGSIPTRKNAQQREQIKKWLIQQVKAILAIEAPKPKFNEWCPWCPLMESCQEPRRAADFAQMRIEELAPPGVDLVTLVGGDLETYLQDMYQFETVRKTVERYEEAVKGVLRELPPERLQQLGWGKYPSSRDVWSPDALRRVYNLTGDTFFLLVKMTKTNIQRFYGTDKDGAGEVLQLAEKERQAPRLSRKK